MADYKKLALEIARANTEAAVDRIIRNNAELSNPINWAPFNNEDKNWDRVGNQASNPAAALTEKIVNSIDAVLTKECLKRGMDPRSAGAPTSMRDAVKTFFGVHDGLLGNADAGILKKLADNIQIIVSGDPKTPCYSVIDRGEGQLPEKFPATYLSLSKKNKEGIKFVQGKYNMGGTATLPFCGDNYYHLIIARRNNELVKDVKNNPWGFTIIRRRDPREGEDLPVIEYFIPGGKEGRIASFNAESLPLLPAGIKNLHSAPLECGTFIKLYDYRMGPSDRSVDFGLLNALCRTMFMSCLPMWLKDSRVIGGHTWERVFCGADVRLENEEQEYILGTPFSSELNFPEIGSIKWTAIPFTRKIPWANKYSTTYVMNGQTHAAEAQDFLDNANLSWLKKRLLVVVDCTEMKKEAFHKVFKADREKMREVPQAMTLRKELCQALGKHPGLKELNRKIHEEALMDRVKDESDVQSLFSQLAQSDPNMAALFDSGAKLLTLVKSRGGEEKEFKGRKFPTKLDPVKHYDKDGAFPISAGSYRLVKAITDAENNYLMRARHRGKLEYEPKEWSVSCGLSNGLVNFKIAVPSDAVVGETKKVFLGFSDIEKLKPLGFFIDVIVRPEEATIPPDDEPDEPEVEKEKKKNPPKPPKVKETLTRNMPDIIEVRQDDPNWERFEMNEKSGFAIMPKEGSKAIEIFANMSNIYLTQFLLKYKRPADTEIVNKQYKVAMALAACSLWSRVEKNDKKDEIIAIASSALAQIILTAIRRLGNLNTVEDAPAQEESS